MISTPLETTILKIINGLVDADSGMIKLGTNVHIGYYDQEQHNLTDENTLFEEIANSYPNMTNTKIRNTLAAFMFTGEDVFKRVSDLSGGEKGRLSLAKLMLSEANLIILDEPTSGIDPAGVREFMDLIHQLSHEEGLTVLFSSHHLDQVQQVCNRVGLFSSGKLLADIELTEQQKKEHGLDDIYNHYFEGGKGHE